MCLAVIPAKAGLRRQDAEANIRDANGPKGEPMNRRVIQCLICFAVIPAKAGLRRQDAEANIRDANGPKGEPMDRRVIQ